MHFVTGGAYNGKKTWVKKTYDLKKRKNFLWISAYEGQKLPDDQPSNDQSIAIYEGIEQWLKFRSIESNLEDCREFWNEKLFGWKQWEDSNPENMVILIGTDITKGIVPLDETDRTWRDVTGWCYQDTVRISHQVDLIWYGINQQLK